jgi:hypothetical protein
MCLQDNARVTSAGVITSHSRFHVVRATETTSTSGFRTLRATSSLVCNPNVAPAECALLGQPVSPDELQTDTAVAPYFVPWKQFPREVTQSLTAITESNNHAGWSPRCLLPYGYSLEGNSDGSACAKALECDKWAKSTNLERLRYLTWQQVRAEAVLCHHAVGQPVPLLQPLASRTDLRFAAVATFKLASPFVG